MQSIMQAEWESDTQLERASVESLSQDFRRVLQNRSISPSVMSQSLATREGLCVCVCVYQYRQQDAINVLLYTSQDCPIQCMRLNGYDSLPRHEVAECHALWVTGPAP